MPKESEDTSLEREKKGFLWKELRSLIDILQDLHLQISSKLLEKRMQSSNSSSVAAGSGEISNMLRNYIDTNLGGQTRSENVPGSPQRGSAEPATGESAVDFEPEPKSPADTLTHPNELSGYLKDQEAGREFGHHLGEKMRATALEHINITLRLAKQGDRERAYIHAELVENAMHLACQYMSETEFEALENEVKARMDTARLSIQGIPQ